MSLTISYPFILSLSFLRFLTAKSPGVICIQEWWGVDFEIKAHAQHIASHGYRCLIPDLYRGKLGVEAEEAHHLMSNLDWVGAVADIAGAAQYLRTEGSSKVACIGFCMGGALTIASTVRHPELIDACAPFYGIPPGGLADPTKLQRPLQGHYGDQDKMAGFSDPISVNQLEENVKISGAPYEMYRYATVGHAFMNATSAGKERRSKLGQGEHDQQAVDLAWSRIFAFFGKYLA